MISVRLYILIEIPKKGLLFFHVVPHIKRDMILIYLFVDDNFGTLVVVVET